MKQLQEQLVHLKGQNESFQAELKKKDKIISKLQEQNKELKLSFPQPDMASQLTQYQNFQIFTRDKELRETKQKNESLNQELAKLRAILRQNLSNSDCVLQEVTSLKEQLDQQKMNHQNVQKYNDELLLSKQMEAAFRIELEHLRAENAIFSTLLGNHPALKEEDQFAHTTAQVELKLLKKELFPKKPTNVDVDYCQNCNKEVYYYRPCCNLLAKIDDKLFFVPQGAFDFATTFRDKYIHSKNDLLVDELFELLLFELNKFWHQRERTNLFKLKKKCEEHSNHLKRQLNSLDYDDKQTLQTLKRLKSEIKDLQNENLEFYNSRFQPK